MQSHTKWHVADPDPNAAFTYLVKQIYGLGLAYLLMIEPRITKIPMCTGRGQEP